MQVTLNGQVRDIADGVTLLGLLQQLELSEERVAVEHNREIVTRERWPDVGVKPGDQLEIVHFVGGG